MIILGNLTEKKTKSKTVSKEPPIKIKNDVNEKVKNEKAKNDCC